MQDKDMKVREILLELAEVLDRHSHYGEWIDANTKKIFPVDTYGHEDFIKNNKDKLEIPQNVYAFNEVGFHNNLVRVMHKPASSINVQGKSNDIEKIANILVASIIQPDVDSAYIDKIGKGSERFELPADRRAAIQFIRGE
jgi:hypothetical protein